MSCAQGFYDKVMEHMSSSAAPLNRLIGVINAFLSLIPGVQLIPCIGGLDGTPSVIRGRTPRVHHDPHTIVHQPAPQVGSRSSLRAGGRTADG